MPNKRKPKYSPVIMNELLNEPTVKEKVDQMTPDEVKMFKDFLVTQGTYARYVLHKQRQALIDAWNKK